MMVDELTPDDLRSCASTLRDVLDAHVEIANARVGDNNKHLADEGMRLWVLEQAIAYVHDALEWVE